MKYLSHRHYCILWSNTLTAVNLADIEYQSCIFKAILVQYHQNCYDTINRIILEIFFLAFKTFYFFFIHQWKCSAQLMSRLSEHVSKHSWLNKHVTESEYLLEVLVFCKYSKVSDSMIKTLTWNRRIDVQTIKIAEISKKTAIGYWTKQGKFITSRTLLLLIEVCFFSPFG